MKVLQNKNGFTLIEVLVVALLLGIIGLAGSMMMVQSQSIWGVIDVNSQLQTSMRLAVSKIADELQESGRDSGGSLKVTVLNNTGVNNSDILRFSVPLCACGANAIDTNGNVTTWGAPSTWGQSGCDTNYTIQGNGLVQICHVNTPSPLSTSTMDVALNTVQAHLAHGDWIGDCAACVPTNNTNITIEYLMDASGQLLRRVLDGANAVVSTAVFAQNLTDFQVSLNGAAATLTISFSKVTIKRRTLSLSAVRDVALRNY